MVPTTPSRPVIGILHPGAMGAALGSAFKARAGAVIWADAGRSHATAKRAELADLVAVPDVADLARRADVIVSICPPHAARDVADRVAEGLAGRTDRPLYVEANAVAPETVRGVAGLLGERATVCDGAVIGPPGWEPGSTVLWLAGPGAERVAGLLDGSPFATRVLGDDPGDVGTASALKTCFALQSKALPALWLAMEEAAERFGVSGPLHDELTRTGRGHTPPGGRVPAADVRWRWAGEMDEAAGALAAVGVPDGFSRAAGEMYRRTSGDPERRGPGTAARVVAVALDCADLEAQTSFWTAALDRPVSRRWGDAHGTRYVEIDLPGGPGVTLLLQEVPGDLPSGKNRLHLDLRPAAGRGRDEEVRRLTGLGAAVLTADPAVPWVVMSDPERNEFCVLSP